MEKQHVILEYHKYKETYTQKYGDKTVIFMQLGSFYEMCAVLEGSQTYGETNIYEICDNLLNIAVAKKKNKTSQSSLPSGDTVHYLQAGFPMPSREKYVPILLNHGYTVVIVDQVTEPPNPERKVTEILSPGTYIESNSSSTNYLVSVYLEKNVYQGCDKYIAGLSSIDLSTGKNEFHEIPYHEDPTFWNDELSRLFHFYEPKEILFHLNGIEMSSQDMIHRWELTHDSIHIDYFQNSVYLKPSYQNEFLNRVFQLNCMVSPLELFGMERKREVSLSYVYMIAYIYEHRQDLVSHLDHPQEYRQRDCLLLHSNAIRQLNVIQNYSYYRGKHESLYELCNHCSTSMGKRLLKQRFLYPSIHSETIQRRYDQIEFFETHSDNISVYLSSISDLDKQLRLLGLQRLTPYDIYSMNLSYEYVTGLFTSIQNSLFLENKRTVLSEYTTFHKELQDQFEWSHIQNVPATQQLRSIFCSGIYPELDELDKEIDKLRSDLDSYCVYLSKYIDAKQDNVVKWGQDKQDHWYLYCTNRRAQKFKEAVKNTCSTVLKIKQGGLKEEIKVDKLLYRKLDKSSTVIEFPQLVKISSQLKQNYKRLSKMNESYFVDTTTKLYTQHADTLKQIHSLIAEIDVSHNGYKLSKRYNYVRPMIVDDLSSHVSIEELRHPLVEQINDQIPYTTNDVELHEDKEGMLLFGTNACGKSTFMKAIGLNIVLAQAGYFVASSKMTLSPFHQLFTRILNNDNIFRSQSSFAVEIEELRSLLKQSCEKSLVLGDELCSGTETNSALSIVSSGLHTLAKKRCKFVFTSHLHQLTTLPIVKEISNLQICHLQIRFESGQLIYDRKLKSGSGPPVYGLKVCEALGMPSDFLDLAHQIQKQLLGFEPNPSNYNASVVLDLCEICGDPAEETDHIREQQSANDLGMIDHFHKNNKHNLVGLCKSCHAKKTKGLIQIHGWEQTSEGNKLKYSYTDQVKQRKKYTDKQVEQIKQYKKEYEENKENCRKLIFLQEKIQISKSLLTKIMTNTY